MANIQIRHFGRVLPNGNISFYNVELWQEQRESLAGKEFELTIKERHKRPSVSQFGYYWGAILKTCLQNESFSHYTTVEELHKEVMAPMFLCYQIRVVVGKKKYDKHMVKSLTELNKKETSEFIDNVLNFVAQEGVIVLSPESYTDKYYREIHVKE
jgi:hypothetical protein|tara:strand:- start:3017 stop:3484 length:468 start_codon:yes stop_codon:yes gene_type:complete